MYGLGKIRMYQSNKSASFLFVWTRCAILVTTLNSENNFTYVQYTRTHLYVYLLLVSLITEFFLYPSSELRNNFTFFKCQKLGKAFTSD